MPSPAWLGIGCPGFYGTNSHEFFASNGGYCFPSYWEILRRYLISPKEPPAHPFPNAG